ARAQRLPRRQGKTPRQRTAGSYSCCFLRNGWGAHAVWVQRVPLMRRFWFFGSWCCRRYRFGIPASRSLRGEALARPRQALAQGVPVETRPRVLLAPGSDMFVPGDMGDGVALRDRAGEPGKCFVLRRLESVAL